MKPKVLPSSIEEFIEWANSTPAVTWGGSDGVKDRYRQLVVDLESEGSHVVE